MTMTAKYQFDPSIHKTVARVAYFNALNGQFFFSRDTMKAFGSKIETRNLIGGRYFITSERGLFDESKRTYKIRRVNDYFGIATFSENSVDSGFPSLHSAREALRSALGKPPFGRIGRSIGEMIQGRKVAEWMKSFEK